MPRPFNEEEKNQIRVRLLEEGKDLFVRFGLKKTGITELTKAAGISQGAFYLFFNSKEELYFAILEQEEQVIRERFLDWLSKAEPLNRNKFREFLRLALQALEENPLLRRLWLEKEIDDLLNKLPSSLMEQHTARDTEVLEPLIKHWQEAGYMVEGSSEVIAGVIRALFLLPLHYQEIGEDLFPEVLDKYIDFVSNGLLKEDYAEQ